jgi:hypothetical protein
MGEKTEVIDIQIAENGAVFTEYDDQGGEYLSVAEGDNQFKMLGEIIFDEITMSNLVSDKIRLTIKFEEL